MTTDSYEMRRIEFLVLVAFVVGCLPACCARANAALQNDSSTAGTISGAGSDSGTNQSGSQDYQRAKDTALAVAKQRYEEALTNPPPRQVRLPNFVAGPGLPPPIAVNFYETRRYYPEYLLCTYGVSENHYDQSNEPAWFKAALLQIRGYGSRRFPPIRWIAIAIKNDAEHKEASTFEQSFKVGAIFKAGEVFDLSRDLTQLIAQAQMDRHPFVYDPNRESPGEQQRWVIVERHAAALTTTNSNEKAIEPEPSK